VQVSSDEDNEIDVGAIADRVLEAEFDAEAEQEDFLRPATRPTNLSEHADDRGAKRTRPAADADAEAADAATGQVNDDD
jgi:DNA-directed RNA polymerase subunit A'